MKHLYCLLITSFIFCYILTAQTRTQCKSPINEDSVIVQSIIDESSKFNVIDESTLAEIAKLFLEKPYVAKTLEKNQNEQLVINLRELDCLTLVENCIALWLTMQSENRSFQEFESALTKIRYRDGEIDQYPSRLHYWSDWAYNNQQKNILLNISKDLGGDTRKFTVNFMTTFSQYYAQLIDKESFVEEMRNDEKEISKRVIPFVPKEKLEEVQTKISSGDIIGFISTIDGLDIAHTGIAIRENGVVRLIHASSDAKKVVISSNSLVEYTKSMRKHNGIVVLRLKRL